MKRHTGLIATGMMILVLAGCANAAPEKPGPPTPEPPIKAPTKTPDAPGEFEYGLMGVDEVDVRVLGPAPAEVEVRVMGVLGDACTEFDSVEQARDGDTVRLTLGTRRPAEMLCAQMARVYERTVRLEGTFEVGTYRVVANGIEAAFEVTGPGEEEWVEGLAFVKNVDVALLESYPVQVMLTVSGWLPGGCTELDAVTQAREGNTVRVTMTTRRPAEAMCTQALVDFTENVKLEGGFESGDYLVVVNDVQVPIHVD